MAREWVRLAKFKRAPCVNKQLYYLGSSFFSLKLKIETQTINFHVCANYAPWETLFQFKLQESDS